MSNKPSILIFKTDIEQLSDLVVIAPILSADSGIQKWSIDLHDQDRVLRIETNSLPPEHIQCILSEVGYSCQELPD